MGRFMNEKKVVQRRSSFDTSIFLILCYCLVTNFVFKKKIEKLKVSKIKCYTVKLGYNELGYNENSVITNDFFSPKWLFYCINQPGYNETRS